MGEQKQLKLTSSKPAPDSYVLERRTTVRRRTSGQVTAMVTSHNGGDSVNRICSFELRDMSDRGIGVWSYDDMLADSRVTIYFPPHGGDPGFDMQGRIVRSVARDSGYEVGIQTFRQTAAA
jgi:hypothetical protein